MTSGDSMALAMTSGGRTGLVMMSGTEAWDDDLPASAVGLDERGRKKFITQINEGKETAKFYFFFFRHRENPNRLFYIRKENLDRI